MKIFCASTGRCGTRYAAWVFRTYTDTAAFHEPSPTLCGTDADALNASLVPGLCIEALPEETRKRLIEKFEFVGKNTNEGTRDYFEGSNMWIKAWAPFALERWPGEVGILRIRRDLAGYLLSFTRRGKRGKKGRFHSVFLLDPTGPGNKIKGYPGMSFYETVAWNYFEVEARYQKARERAAGFYEMDFKDIDSPREWARAFKTFGIPHRLPAIFQKTKERHQSIFDDKAKLLALGHLKERWAEPRTPVDPETMAKILRR